jgi:hypothetical protein
MPKTITMRELNEMLSAQEEELSAEFGARQKSLIAENERLWVKSVYERPSRYYRAG